MTKYTPNLAIPYPESADVPDGAGQMQALASRVDDTLSPHVLASDNGTVSATLAGIWVFLPTGADTANQGWTLNGASLWVPPVNGWYRCEASIAYSAGSADVGLSNGGLGGNLILWQNGPGGTHTGVLRASQVLYLNTSMALGVLAIGQSPTSVGQALFQAELVSQATLAPSPTKTVTPVEAF